MILSYRYWRPSFTGMGTCWTTTQNCRKHWFGFTFTQTFQSSTRWNVGVHWRMRVLHQVGPMKRVGKVILQVTRARHNHAKITVTVAFHPRVQQPLGLKSIPVTTINIMMRLLEPSATCKPHMFAVGTWLS